MANYRTTLLLVAQNAKRQLRDHWSDADTLDELEPAFRRARGGRRLENVHEQARRVRVVLSDGAIWTLDMSGDEDVFFADGDGMLNELVHRVVERGDLDTVGLWGLWVPSSLAVSSVAGAVAQAFEAREAENDDPEDTYAFFDVVFSTQFGQVTFPHAVRVTHPFDDDGEGITLVGLEVAPNVFHPQVEDPKFFPEAARLVGPKEAAENRKRLRDALIKWQELTGGVISAVMSDRFGPYALTGEGIVDVLPSP